MQVGGFIRVLRFPPPVKLIFLPEHPGKSNLPRRHTWAKFSKSNIPLSGVGNFNRTASMVSMVSGPGK